MNAKDAYDKALQAQYRHRRDIGLSEWERRKKELDFCGSLLSSLTAQFKDSARNVVAYYDKDLDGSETAQLLRIVYEQVNARHKELVLLTNGAEYVHWMRVYVGIEDAA